MNMARAFEVMCRDGLVDWPAVASGWKNHWIGKEQIAGWARSWLARHREDEGMAEVELARADHLDDAEVSARLDRVCERHKKGKDEADARWRLAALADLAASEMSWDEKVTSLEGIAAEFGYPDDMRECTRYGPAGVDPLDAMAGVIEKLKAELGVPSRIT